jgi:hypothetical protein
MESAATNRAEASLLNENETESAASVEVIRYQEEK